MTYVALGMVLPILFLGIRLWGLRNDLDRARKLANAREAERDAVLARLTAEEDKAHRLGREVEAQKKEITRLWGVLRRMRSDEALDELLKDELG